MKRVNDYKVHIEKSKDMNVGADIFISKKIEVDDKALKQLKDAAKIPTVTNVIATPDIHTGYGVPIGCVMATERVVSPSAVGYDINCGMRLITTPFLKKDINIDELAHSIYRDIPLGEGKQNIKLKNKTFSKLMQQGLEIYPEIIKSDERLSRYYNEDEFYDDMVKTEDKGSMSGTPSAVHTKATGRGINQLGTLGGGNHFIEIQEVVDIFDKETAKTFGIELGMITIMLHSGSRGFGHEIAGQYMRLSKNKCKQLKMATPSPELTYLKANTSDGKNFVGAMHAAANFAFVNRLIMTNLIRKNIRHYYGKDIKLPSVYDVPHNMVKMEEHYGKKLWIHRKGATRAFDKSLMKNTPFSETGQPVIIPGSMGTFSYILSGNSGGKESLYSVCHGAGRVMSRTQAAGRRKKGKLVNPAAITDEQFKKSMDGIILICEKPSTIKEEAPGAYKDINEVINVVVNAGLAKNVARMKPLAVLKG